PAPPSWTASGLPHWRSTRHSSRRAARLLPHSPTMTGTGPHSKSTSTPARRRAMTEPAGIETTPDDALPSAWLRFRLALAQAIAPEVQISVETEGAVLRMA